MGNSKSSVEQNGNGFHCGIPICGERVDIKKRRKHGKTFDIKKGHEAKECLK